MFTELFVCFKSNDKCNLYDYKAVIGSYFELACDVNSSVLSVEMGGFRSKLSHVLSKCVCLFG